MEDNLPYCEPIAGGSPVPWIPTESEIRRYNKQFTTRELPKVEACGHSIDPDVMPRTHCNNCWFAYFNQDGERITDLHKEYKEDSNLMTSKYGSKFVKMFTRFMATVIKMEKDGKPTN